MNTATVHPTAPQQDKDHHIADEENPAHGQAQDTLTRGKTKGLSYKFKRNRFTLLLVITVMWYLGSWMFTNYSFKRFEAPLGPSPETAYDSLTRAYSEPNRTAKLWEQCIHREAERCRNETAVAHDLEAARIDTIATSNKEKIDMASEMATHCTLLSSDANTAIREEVFSNGTLPWTGNQNCTEEERAAILKAAGDDVRKDQNAIIGIYEQAKMEDRKQISILEAWGADYFRYNQEYFFGDLGAFELMKLDLLPQLNALPGEIDISFPGFDALVACFSTHDLHKVPCPITPVPVSLHGITYISEGIIAVAEEQLELAKTTIATLVAKYDEKVDDIRDLVRILQGIRNVLGRPFDLALNALGGVDFNKFDSIPPGYLYVPGDLDFPGFPGRPPIQPILDEVAEEILRIKAASIEIVNQAKDELKDAVKNIVTSLEFSVDKILHDYHPPPFPGFLNATEFGAALREFDERHAKYSVQFERALNKLKESFTTVTNVSDYEEYTPEDIALNVPENYKDPEAILLGIQIPKIPEFIKTVFDILVEWGALIEFFVRAFAHYCRFRKFFEPASVPVPLITVGTPGADRSEEEEQERKENQKWYVKLFNAIFNAKTGWYIGGVIMVLAVAAGGWGYSQYIGHYQYHCVDHETGTFFAQEVAVGAVHDIVTLGGNAAMKQEQVGLYIQRRTACLNLQGPSHVIDQQHKELLFSAEYDYNEAMAESIRSLDCIDLDALDHSDSKLSEDLRTCSVPLAIALEDGVAKCDWPKCEIQCNQRQVTEDIKRDFLENACIYEWYLHSSVMTYCLMVFQYCCLIAANLLIESALIALFRKSLRRDSVKWIYEQDMETGEIIGAEGMCVEEAKAQALKAFERREKRVAVAKIAVAAVLVASFVVLRIYVAKADDFLQPSWFVPTEV